MKIKKRRQQRGKQKKLWNKRRGFSHANQSPAKRVWFEEEEQRSGPDFAVRRKKGSGDCDDEGNNYN
jgi:hypothetical protein